MPGPHGRRQDLSLRARLTYVDVANGDGVRARWESRRHRKHPHGQVTGSTWWEPRQRGWWIAVLFAAGSLLFALGSVAAYATAVGYRWDNVTFFAGSLFFTAASFLTYREMVDAIPSAQNRSGRRFFVYQPGQIDWWATGIQLIGTVFFNLSTGAATIGDLSAQAAHRHVWRPDALGSVCFLVSSALAWYEVCHGWAAWRPKSWGWWITLANLAGSLAFGVSAVAAYVDPASGQLRNSERARLGTLVGAVCFFLGAVLLLPERTEKDSGTCLCPWTETGEDDETGC